MTHQFRKHFVTIAFVYCMLDSIQSEQPKTQYIISISSRPQFAYCMRITTQLKLRLWCARAEMTVPATPAQICARRFFFSTQSVP